MHYAIFLPTNFPDHPCASWTFSYLIFLNMLKIFKLNFDTDQRVSRNFSSLHALSLTHLRKHNLRSLANTYYLQIYRHISWNIY